MRKSGQLLGVSFLCLLSPASGTQVTQLVVFGQGKCRMVLAYMFRNFLEKLGMVVLTCDPNTQGSRIRKFWARSPFRRP